MNWHYLDNGQQRGPVTEEQFTQLVQQGVIRDDTFIWCQGMEKWRRYGELVPATAGVSAVADAGTTAVLEEGGGGLHLQQEEVVPAETREGACSQCGAVVPVTHLMTIGSRQLCPRCQVGQRRLAATGWHGGAAEYANPWLRVGACILDGILCSVIIFVIGLAIIFGGVTLGKATESPNLMVAAVACYYLFGLVFALHYFVSRVANDGGPIIMRKMGMKVVTTDGDRVGWWRALWRHIALNLIFGFTFGLGNLTALFDKQNRCLHDILSGTIVIKS